MAALPNRGEVWWVDLSPTRGHEQRGNRPAVVVSTNKFNQGASNLVMVTPLTRTERNLPTWVRIDPPEGGVTDPSFAMCDQLRSISRDRLLDAAAVGTVAPGTMRRIIEIISILLQLH